MSAPERHQTSPGRQDAGLWATLAKTHAAGTLLPAHQHRSGQLVFATRGVMLVETPHARWTVPPQRALWVPPHHAHAIEILSATDLRTVYCQPALVAQCASFARRDEVHAVIASPLIQQLVLGLFNGGGGPPPRLPMPASEGLRRALALLLQAHQWQLSLHELAAEAAMSDRTFTRRFTAEAGLSFRAWRQRARIIASLDLLASGRPVKGIAHALQFESPAAYIASFRTLLGCTPNTFRQGQHGDTHP